MKFILYTCIFVLFIILYFQYNPMYIIFIMIKHNHFELNNLRLKLFQIVQT